MQRLGFIHDMMDVKVLILYVAARSNYPMSTQELYELCYVDDGVSYFDVCTAIPEMVSSGHLEERADGKYQITAKGKQDGDLTADSIAYTVKQKAENASFSAFFLSAAAEKRMEKNHILCYTDQKYCLWEDIL